MSLPKPYKYTIEELKQAVSESFSVRQVLFKLGLVEAGGNYASIKSIMKRLDIDNTHFTGMGHLKGKVNHWSKSKPWDEVLIENSLQVLHSSQKRRLIAEGLLKSECACCGLKQEWQGKPLVLHIDHINGNPFDNQLDNLRPLCPNCHSQTDTYCAKNKKKKANIKKPRKIILNKSCVDCSKSIRQRSTRCNECLVKYTRTQTKIDWPSNDILLQMVKNYGYSATGRKLGVSNTAVKKRLKK